VLDDHDGAADHDLDQPVDEPDDEAFGDDEHAPPTPIKRFEQSAAGVVLSAGLLGLRDVLEGPKKEEVQVVSDWSGDKPFTDPYVLRLDPEHPEDSIVMVRPWLRDEKPDPAS